MGYVISKKDEVKHIVFLKHYNCVSIVKDDLKLDFYIYMIFSSPEPKAHGELIGYPWSVVRPSFTISNIFFSKTARPIKAKFYVEPPWVGGTKGCSRHLGHKTKIAARPIYGKNPFKIFFSRTSRLIFTKLCMKYRGLLLIIVCSNDDPGVTLTYLRQGQIW